MKGAVYLPMVVVALLSCTNGCGNSGVAQKPASTGQVEVAPGVFAVVQLWADSTPEPAPLAKALAHSLNLHRGEYSESTELRIQWQGTNVHWKGNSIPITLRVLDGKLCLIAWDRLTLGFDHNKGLPRAQFRYYAQDGAELREIAPAKFPKPLATQNVGFMSRYLMTDQGQRDEVQIARDLDPRDIQFRCSVTAKIWCHLATGQQYCESPYTIDQVLLEDFVRTNQPIKLTFANYFKEAENDNAEAGSANLTTTAGKAATKAD